MKCDYCGKRHDSSDLTHVNDSGFDMQACKKCLEAVAYVYPLDVDGYGEPWVIGDPFSIYSEERGDVIHLVDFGFTEPSDVARTVACVNALAGMNPEKLAALIEAVENAELVFIAYAELHRLKGTPDGDQKAEVNSCQAELLRTALRELRGER